MQAAFSDKLPQTHFIHVPTKLLPSWGWVETARTGWGQRDLFSIAKKQFLFWIFFVLYTVLFKFLSSGSLVISVTTFVVVCLVSAEITVFTIETFALDLQTPYFTLCSIINTFAKAQWIICQFNSCERRQLVQVYETRNTWKKWCPNTVEACNGST